MAIRDQYQKPSQKIEPNPAYKGGKRDPEKVAEAYKAIEPEQQSSGKTFNKREWQRAYMREYRQGKRRRSDGKAQPE